MLLMPMNSLIQNVHGNDRVLMWYNLKTPAKINLD